MPRPTPLLTLFVPRAIPVVVLGLAMVWTVPLLAAAGVEPARPR